MTFLFDKFISYVLVPLEMRTDFMYPDESLIERYIERNSLF